MMKSARLTPETTASCWMPSIPQPLQRLGFALGIILSLGALIAGFLALYHISIFAAIGSPISEALLYGGGALLLVTLASWIIKRCVAWRAEVALQEADYKKRHPKPDHMVNKEKPLKKPPKQISEPPPQPIEPSIPQPPKVWAPLQLFAGACATNDYAPILRENQLAFPSIQIPEQVLSPQLWKKGFINGMSRDYAQLLRQGTPLDRAKILVTNHLDSFNQNQSDERLKIDIEEFFTKCAQTEKTALGDFIKRHVEEFSEKLTTQAEPFITEELIKHEKEIHEAIEKEVGRFNEAMGIFISDHPEYAETFTAVPTHYVLDILFMTSKQVLQKKMESLFNASSEKKIEQIIELDRICPPFKYIPQPDILFPFFDKLVAYFLEGYPIDFEDPNFTEYQSIKHQLEKIRDKLGISEISMITSINKLIDQKIQEELFPHMEKLLGKDKDMIVTPTINEKIKNLRFLADRIPQGENGWAMNQLRSAFCELIAKPFFCADEINLNDPEDLDHFKSIKLLIEQIATKLELPTPEFELDMQEAMANSEAMARALQEEADAGAAVELDQSLNGRPSNPNILGNYYYDDDLALDLIIYS